jgi:hypothetical protein
MKTEYHRDKIDYRYMIVDYGCKEYGLWILKMLSVARRQREITHKKHFTHKIALSTKGITLGWKAAHMT